MVNIERRLVRDAENAVRRIFGELEGVSLSRRTEPLADEEQCDLVLKVKSAEAEFQIGIDAKSRITPQTAISVCERMRRFRGDVIPAVFAPVISPRVAEILAQYGVGYVDQAGNCQLRSARHHVLIDRRGNKPAVRPPKGAADPFSPKSSRIVRVMLAQPGRGWKVRELAGHADVDVSVGLVVKVKQALLEEGYAIEHGRLLYLRDPVGLLENWSKRYPGPAEQIPMYFLGDTAVAEEAVGKWCRDNDIRCALAGFSAAWRLAPEVRYNVANLYVEGRGFEQDMLEKLKSYNGGKRVETGANLLLWRPFDLSVLANSQTEKRAETPVASAIQTYLDLRQLAGRGEEAATAVYERLLVGPLREASRQIEEMRRDEL